MYIERESIPIYTLPWPRHPRCVIISTVALVAWSWYLVQGDHGPIQETLAPLMTPATVLPFAVINAFRVGHGWIDWVKLVKIGDTIMGLFEISVDFDYKLSYLIIFVKLSLLPPMCGVCVCVDTCA